MSQQQNLRLILKYLRANGYVQSFLTLERQSDVSFQNYSKEILFFRNVLLEGDFSAAVKCLIPLQERLSSQDYKAILFRIYRQKLFELLENPDEIELRELLEKDIVEICSPEEYQELFNFLALERITDHPDFRSWTKISGRLDCFEFIKPYVEFIESKVHRFEDTEPSFQAIVEFYNTNANKLKQSIAVQNSEPARVMENKSIGVMALDNRSFQETKPQMKISMPAEFVQSMVKSHFGNNSNVSSRTLKGQSSQVQFKAEENQLAESNLALSMSIGVSQVPESFKTSKLPENRSNLLQNPSIQFQQSLLSEKSQLANPVQSSQVLSKANQNYSSVKNPQVEHDSGDDLKNISIESKNSRQNLSNVKSPQFQQDSGEDLKNISVQSKSSKTSKKPAPSPISVSESSSVSWGKDLVEASAAVSQSQVGKSQVPVVKQSAPIQSEEINMSLTPSMPVSAFNKSKASMVISASGKPIDPVLELEISKSIKLSGQALEECKSFVQSPNNPLSSTIKQQNPDNIPTKPQFTQSGQNFTKELSGYQASISSSKSVVVKESGANLYEEDDGLQPPQHFDFSRKQNPFLKMMRSVKVAVPKLLASVSDEKAIRVCQFSESGKLLALGTNSSKLKIFDVEDLYKTKLPKHDLEPIYEINNFHQKSVFSIDWSANQKFIASCSNDATVKLTKFNNNLTSHQSNVIGRHEASIRMVRFDAMLTKIVSCAQDHLIKIWDIQKPKSNQVLKGHYSSVNAIRLVESQTTSLIYSVSKDCSIRLWDLRTGQPQAISKPHQSQMTYIARYTQNLLIGHKDGSISFYTPTLQHIQTIQIHKDQTRSIQSCPQQRFYVSASFDGQICLMQRNSKDQLAKTYQRHNLIKQDDKVVFAAFNQSVGFASCSTFGVCNIYAIG